MSDERGSAAVMTVVMLPLLITIVSGVVQLGALRVLAARVASAADLATLAAVDDQDEDELVRTGMLGLAPDADAIARQYFAANLGSVAGFLDIAPEDAAARADVAVFATAPAFDAATGRTYDRPTVRLAATIPVRTPVFGAFLLASSTPISVRVASSAR